ncbi:MULTISPECIES: DUF3526 domain-containing protein [unclassified Chitinophaga]|uniref:DUF3526 domain-containing protein n=1 Tax=unclassified Chitinophaga TaxID=2619133 RepID=UPI001C6FC89E|nr:MULTISPECIES: DUF3526 domain-containing protein [unclassified Chitinophaga]WPV66362.1 DUF3526 domain-containing protein [Chitinophaga sp. LS1]
MLKRSGVAILLLLFIWISMGLALIVSGIQYGKGKAERLAAADLFRREWNTQHRNPHDAAHFGTYLFTPLTIKAILDPGLNDFSGTTYRVEAHVQHEMDYSHAQNGNVVARLGQFSVAVVLQLVVPFLILITGSRSLTEERERGTLRLIRVQAGNLSIITWGKVWAYYMLFSAILFPFLLFFLFTGVMMYLWVIAYLLFYFWLTLVAVFISQVSSSSRASNISAVIVWVVLFVIMPKVAVNQSIILYPVKSRAVFEDNVRQGYLKGFDGNSPYYERGDSFMHALLKRYHVDSVSQLPVNPDGLLLQYHEDYQNKVFDHYYKGISASFAQQQVFLSRIGWIDPFIALKRVSMALSATDFYHHDSFYQQARVYRNTLIRKLNLELAAHGQDYKADTSFFTSLYSFKYRELPPRQILSLSWSAFAAIGVWILIAVASVHIISKRLSGY